MLDTVLDALVGISGFVVMLGIFAFVVWRATRRDDQWHKVAGALGFRYARNDDGPLGPFAGLKVFDTLGPRSLRNVISGTRGGANVWVADYAYSNRIVGTTQPYGFTICLLQHERLAVPHFLLRSHGRPRSMTNAPLLQRDEDDPEVSLAAGDPFAAAFRLNTRSGDEVEARLTPALRERLLQLEKPYLEVEGFGDRLAVSRRCWVDPAKAGAALDQAMEILEHLLKAGDPARR